MHRGAAGDPACRNARSPCRGLAAAGWLPDPVRGAPDLPLAGRPVEGRRLAPGVGAARDRHRALLRGALVLFEKIAKARFFGTSARTPVRWKWPAIVLPVLAKTSLVHRTAFPRCGHPDIPPRK